MGIDAGAEMTTFEMRFIALRCKDTIAPTGTIAQGVGAKQVKCQRRDLLKDKHELQLLSVSMEQHRKIWKEEDLVGTGCLKELRRKKIQTLRKHI